MAIQAIPASQDFIWDGKDDDERPVTPSEFSIAMKNVADQLVQRKNWFRYVLIKAFLKPLELQVKVGKVELIKF